jgi:hypothetical protein
VCGPHHISMLRRCIIAGTKVRFGGHTSPQHPQNYIRLLGGLSPINLTHQNKVQCLVWGIRGAFPPSAAMIVMVFCSLPEHEPLFWLNYGIAGIAESFCLEQEHSCIVLRWRRRDNREKKIYGKLTSVPYIGILII